MESEVAAMGRPAKVSFDTSYIPEPNSGCWLWEGKLWRGGYGGLWIRDPTRPIGWRSVSAHRYSYEKFVGPIPEGMTLDHKCRTPCCINPDHLEPVTHAENVRRGIAGIVNGQRQRSKKHCPSGHLYSLENTRFTRTKDGGLRRQCRACNREQAAAKRAKIKEMNGG